MENPSEDKLQKQFEAAKACLESMCPPAEGTRRAAVVSSTIGALTSYRTFLSNLEGAGETAAVCGGLRGQLPDRAFEAEGQVRVLLAEGLNTLNDLRDSGVLHLSLNSFAQALDGGKLDFLAAARETVKKVQEALDLPAQFTDEALGIIERRAVTVRYERESETLVVRTGQVENGSEEARIRIAPRAGDTGRIDLQHFFGSDGGFSVYPEPAGSQGGDCHRRTGQVQPLQSIDAYSGMVGALASAREAMYRHARKVTQYGHGSTVRAQDPVVVLVVAIVVVFVALVVAALPGSPAFTFAGMSIPIGAAIAIVALVAVVVIGLLFF
jgi:hypothetical protein